MNKVILIGRLGKDPEVKTAASGVQVANFSIATEDRKKNGSTYEKVTDWHNLVAFGKTAEVVKSYLKKGSLCAVEGKIKTESYEKDGEKRYITKVIVERLELLSGRSDSNSGSFDGFSDSQERASAMNYKGVEQQLSFDDDDIPF